MVSSELQINPIRETWTQPVHIIRVFFYFILEVVNFKGMKPVISKI